MGKCHLADLDEDFNSLQSETEAAREALERLSEASEEYLKAVSRRIEGKELPIETFGMSMAAQARILPEGSTYREALTCMGEVHIKIGIAQREMVNQFSTSYILSLQKEQSLMKEYQNLQRKLHSRKTDYDAKLAKLQKAKREKPEWAEELHSAKSKYEHVRECVFEMMLSIVDFQDGNISNLKSYYDAQLSFARKVLEALEDIPENTFNMSNQDPSIYSFGLRSHKSGSDVEGEPNSENCLSDHAVLASPNERGRSSSVYDTHRRSRSKLTRAFSSSASMKPRSSTMPAKSVNTSSVPSSPISPTRISSLFPNLPHGQKFVRAIYNFDASADEELSLRKGDIVRVIEKIDDGWWDGELFDKNGIRYGGMFPSNYVEEMRSKPNDNTRQCSSCSNSSASTQYLDEEEAVYYERPTDIYDEPELTVLDTILPSPVDIPALPPRRPATPLSQEGELQSHSVPILHQKDTNNSLHLPILHRKEYIHNMSPSPTISQPVDLPHTTGFSATELPIASRFSQLSGHTSSTMSSPNISSPSTPQPPPGLHTALSPTASSPLTLLSFTSSPTTLTPTARFLTTPSLSAEPDTFLSTTETDTILSASAPSPAAYILSSNLRTRAPPPVISPGAESPVVRPRSTT
ncbi:hypothetical protein BGZ76_011298 [Entomortierella beljakovae]|nr:hypothetical protein BGZ76_011298 [Entomortierella beljakovae]